MYWYKPLPLYYLFCVQNQQKKASNKSALFNKKFSQFKMGLSWLSSKNLTFKAYFHYSNLNCSLLIFDIFVFGYVFWIFHNRFPMLFLKVFKWKIKILRNSLKCGFICQVDGYTSDTSWAFFNGTIPADLISFTFCHRFKLFQLILSPSRSVTGLNYSNWSHLLHVLSQV